MQEEGEKAAVERWLKGLEDRVDEEEKRVVVDMREMISKE
jgi:hypothetical protein